MAKRLLIGAVLAFTFLGAERQEVPVTGRAQRVAISDQQASTCATSRSTRRIQRARSSWSARPKPTWTVTA